MYYYEHLTVIFLVILLVINLFVIATLTDIASEKGHSNKTGRIWLIGILGTSILAALYVIALPNKKLEERLESIHSAIQSIETGKVRAYEHQEAMEMVDKLQETKNRIS